MGMDLQGKRIIVTGGTSGIGKAIAIRAAESGADVAFCGLTHEGADETRDSIDRAGRRAFFRAFDIADLAAARRFTEAAVDFLGGLDGLVNNAGTFFGDGVAGATFDGVEKCFMTNFYSAWAVSQAARPALKAAGRGVIVNISSVHARQTGPGAFPYNASKAALSALTQSIALEWGVDNIFSVAIAPGWVLTPLNEKGFQATGSPEAEKERIESGHVLGSMARPEHVASFAVYLLGDANGSLNGNTVIVDGGMHGRYPLL